MLNTDGQLRATLVDTRAYGQDVQMSRRTTEAGLKL